MRISDWSSDVGSSDLLLHRARPERDADVVDPPEGVQVEVELAAEPAEPADIDDASQLGRGLQVLVGDIARDLVDDQFDPLPVRRRQHRVAPAGIARSEQPRVGQECARTCTTRGAWYY